MHSLMLYEIKHYNMLASNRQQVYMLGEMQQHPAVCTQEVSHREGDRIHTSMSCAAASIIAASSCAFLDDAPSASIASRTVHFCVSIPTLTFAAV